MTAYEIADLRNQIDQFSLGVVRLWLTAMFASFAVAYTMGDALDTMTISFLIGFYTIIIAIVSQALWGNYKRAEALLVEADGLPPAETTGYATRQVMNFSLTAKIGIFSAIIASYLALCLYLYQIAP